MRRLIRFRVALATLAIFILGSTVGWLSTIPASSSLRAKAPVTLTINMSPVTLDLSVSPLVTIITIVDGPNGLYQQGTAFSNGLNAGETQLAIPPIQVENTPSGTVPGRSRSKGDEWKCNGKRLDIDSPG